MKILAYLATVYIPLTAASVCVCLDGIGILECNIDKILLGSLQHQRASIIRIFSVLFCRLCNTLPIHYSSRNQFEENPFRCATPPATIEPAPRSVDTVVYMDEKLYAAVLASS